MSNSLRRLVGAVVVRGYGRTGRKGLARGGRVRTEGLRPPVCCRAVCGACVSLCLPARSLCRSVGSGFRGRGVPAASNGCGLLCRGFWTRVRSVGGRVAGRGYGRPQAADILVWGTRVVCCGSCGLYGFGPHCEGLQRATPLLHHGTGIPFGTTTSSCSVGGLPPCQVSGSIQRPGLGARRFRATMIAIRFTGPCFGAGHGTRSVLRRVLALPKVRIPWCGR